MNNPRSTLVLMAGLPGAGKSTLASVLSHELNWYVINKDKYKEILIKHKIDEEKAGIATYELSFKITRSVLTHQQAAVIFDRAVLHTFIKEVLINHEIDEEKVSTAIYELSSEITSNVLTQQQTSIIFDSAALHTFILENAQSIVASVPNTQLKVILCIADRHLRNQRLRDRPHQITTIRVDPETITDYLLLFKHLPPDTLSLYSHRPLKEYLADAKSYLES